MLRGDLKGLGIETKSHALGWDVLRSRGEIRALSDEWSDLHRSSGTRNPFSHPAWLGTWFDYFTQDGDAYVVTARAAGRLVAVAPFHRRTSRIASPFPGTCLRLAGMGASEVLTELPDVLIDHPQPRKVMRGLMHFLIETRGADWDWLELVLSPEAGWFESDWIGREPESNGATFVPRAALACVVMDVPESWDALRASMKRNIREAVRRSTNRLAKLGDRWSTTYPADAAEFQYALDALIRLHRARSTVDHKEIHGDYLSDARDEAFLRSAATAMFDAGKGTIAQLSVDGEPAAAGLLLQANGTLFFSITGLDPRHWDLGLGTQLKVQALQRAIADGVTSANLSLNPDESKLRWSETLEFHHEFLVVGQGNGAALAAGAYLMHRAARDAWALRS